MVLLKRKHLSVFRKIVNAVPGKKTFGAFRFLPIFFFIGAGLEFAMIHWTPNGNNFCKKSNLIEIFHYLTVILNNLDHTYKKRRAKEILEEEYKAKLALEIANKT